MEEDIKILEEFIEYSQEMITDMEYERPVDVTICQEQITAIENLLNKYKEQEENIKTLEQRLNEMAWKLTETLVTLNDNEKMIELMAEAFKQDDVRSKEEIIEHFRKKAKGE